MSNNTNKTNVPEAKEAMDRFKMEVANELGVPLSNGYNGNLTSAQKGSVGGLYGSENDREPRNARWQDK